MVSRLEVLRAHARGWGERIRPLALEIDRDPEAIRSHLHLPAVRFLSTMGVPERYGNEPLRVDGHTFVGDSAQERAVIMEELACADVGTLVAAPGPLLAGAAVGLVGDEGQKRWFYDRMLAAPSWTCFALTEPDRGSAAVELTSALVPDGPGDDPDLLLHGEKRYVGNACRADIGVVFARLAPGPLGIRGVLVDTREPGFHAEALDPFGLRGARISAIRMDGIRVPPERVLARGLPVARRGLVAFARTFAVLRPGVAAIAVGIARAAREYVLAHRSSLRPTEREVLDRLGRRIDATRRLVLHAAAAVDGDVRDGALASAAKLRAARLAEDATLVAPRFLGPGARLEHPLLDKLARDARATEFLEGSAHMQRLTVFQGLLTGRLER